MATPDIMDLFRSEEMQLVQLIIPAESAHDTITYLGQLGLLQFKDLNPDKSPFQRTYANQVKRCSEMARKLRFITDQTGKAGIPIRSRSAVDDVVDFDELEVKLADLESELLEVNGNNEKLERSKNELSEMQLVLEKAGAFFSSARQDATAHQRELEEASSSGEGAMDSPLLLEQEMQIDPSKQVRLGFVTGLVAKAKSPAFERVLFRATRGNMFLKQAAIEDTVVDPVTGEEVEKIVFVVFFAGERARTKIMKICEAFGANRYHFPEEATKLHQIRGEVAGRLAELQACIEAGHRHRDNVLTLVGAQLDQWVAVVHQEKAVYHTLNMLSIDVTRKCLVAEGWCPVTAKTAIQDALQRAALDANAQVDTILQPIQTHQAPPTYFKTNRITGCFQEIVDAYGIGRYREANPAVFTIVTFPFLFGVMFGDWGHGILMMGAGAYLVYNEKKMLGQKLGDIMEMAFGGRYVIILMSIFSIYMGLIYNEFFSCAFPMFGSSAYSCSTSDCADATTSGLVKAEGYTYPFGLDPAWHGSTSELPFTNSLKMKMSILLGVTQMMLGIMLSYMNAAYFNLPLNIMYEFIPQVLFLGGIFGYLCFLILLKWCTGSQADLYHIMIYMFLSPMDDLGDNQLFYGQTTLQVVLVLVALVSVPVMLFPKPLTLRAQHMKKLQGRAYGALVDHEALVEEEESHGGGHGEHGEEFEFSEVIVHQMIHTIEFVLGAVSNTASYLRLWALSLAHSQLSAVFYDRVLLTAWETGNVIAILIGFVVFAFATIGVLLIMETLSAFLHALRLHWVEFQNKFYQGDGYKFHPFSFATLAEDEE
eukprot:TRINITY_DN1157_c2_g1_i1.p1 TRINITY_DN1157_c2_g1~~TRINITY_DN1157_c2_g1_i1.p1  ORF type:complete len:820 (-),score=206.26 TRINITY_DN1157_c2_g1_i1:844-3303(-)